MNHGAEQTDVKGRTGNSGERSWPSRRHIPAASPRNSPRSPVGPGWSASRRTDRQRLSALVPDSVVGRGGRPADTDGPATADRRPPTASPSARPGRARSRRPPSPRARSFGRSPVGSSAERGRRRTGRRASRGAGTDRSRGGNDRRRHGRAAPTSGRYASGHSARIETADRSCRAAGTSRLHTAKAFCSLPRPTVDRSRSCIRPAGGKRRPSRARGACADTWSRLAPRMRGAGHVTAWRARIRHCAPHGRLT